MPGSSDRKETPFKPNDRLIIGLTGSFGSGASTIAKYLIERGFKHIKISDFLKEELKKREKIDVDVVDKKEKRKLLQNIGNKLREENYKAEKENGLGILVKLALEEIGQSGDPSPIVIDSIKNPGEITFLKKYPNAYTIAINAARETRWHRVIKDDRYYKDYEIFERDDERDATESEIWGQNVQKCVDMADVYISNDNTRETERLKMEFKEKIISEYISLMEHPGCRIPNDSEIFMNNAYCTSLLSECLKRRVGAIITHTEEAKKINPDGQVVASQKETPYVITTGYNKVPEGQKSCQEEHGMCYRDKTWTEFIDKIKFCSICGGKRVPPSTTCPNCDISFRENAPSKKALDLCRSLHAEENAIIQISRLGGPSLTGSTLYTTTFPCLLCAKKIIASGIDRVVWLEAYPDGLARNMLNDASIKLEEFEGVKAQAFYKLFSKPF